MTIPSAQVRNDIDTIVETHQLSGFEREKLIRIITGAVPGNRDRALFGLAKTIEATLASRRRDHSTLFDLLAPGTKNSDKHGLARLSLALLDFLATMDEYKHFNEIESAVATIAAAETHDATSEAARALAARLYRYRTDHLPFENRRQAFSPIRSHFQTARPDSGLPEDGDAIEFWCAMANQDGWMTYSATLSALVDFVDAAGISYSAKEFSFEALAENGFDTDIDFFRTQESEGPNLEDAIHTLSAADLKIFKGPELDELRRFAAAMPAMKRWRRAGMALLCFGPVQNVLVQIKRQSGSPGRLAVVAGCTDMRDYAQELEVLGNIERTCHDVVGLYKELGARKGQTGPPSSITDAETISRISRIMRRQSFADHEPDAMRAKIEELFPALAAVVTRLGRALVALRAWPSDARDAAFEADRSRFAETFQRLYILPKGASDDTRQR